MQDLETSDMTQGDRYKLLSACLRIVWKDKDVEEEDSEAIKAAILGKKVYRRTNGYLHCMGNTKATTVGKAMVAISRLNEMNCDLKYRGKEFEMDETRKFFWFFKDST